MDHIKIKLNVGKNLPFEFLQYEAPLSEDTVHKKINN
jgi:hypothetical protein